MARWKRRKRTLSDSQRQKMQEGREAAAKQRERVEMLSELDERLRAARYESSDNKVHIRTRRRRRYGP